MRSKWRMLLNLSISSGLLIWVLMQIDWHEVVLVAGATKISLFVASFGVFLLGGALLSHRLYLLLQPTALRTSFAQLLLIWLRSTFYAVFLPSDLGAAIARWYMVTRNETGRRFFIFVTGLERLMLLTGALLLTIGPLAAVEDTRLAEFKDRVLPILLLCLAVCLVSWSVFVPPVYRWFSLFCGWCRERCQSTWFVAVFSVPDDVDVYRRNPRALLKALGAHLLFQLTWCLRAVLVFAALRVTVPLSTMVWMSMLMALITMIPISFAGFGVREFGFSWLTTLYGLGPETGLLVGAAFSLQITLTALLGGIANMKVMALQPRVASDSDRENVAEVSRRDSQPQLSGRENRS